MNQYSLARCGMLLVVASMPRIVFAALALPNPPAAPNIPSRTATLNGPADGVTDATAAINEAIEQLSAQGGGTLQFGAGTFLITVNPKNRDFAVQLESNVRLLGNSNGTTIKLANAQGPYNTMIGAPQHNNTALTLHDVDIESITIDQNGVNNAIVSLADKLAGPKFAVRFAEGERFKVFGCTILNAAGVNTLDFTGGATDIEAGDNSFPNVGQPPGFYDFDVSTIYVHGARVSVHNNTFTARYGPGTTVARTAIETHGDDISVVNNTINAFSIGMIVTGQAESSNRQLYQGNVMNDIANGIEFRSEVYINNSTQGMENITIENNEVNLNPVVWRLTGKVSVAQPSEGIFINPAPKDPAPIAGMAILNNTITFPAVQGIPSSGDTNTGGVLFWTFFGLETPITNLTISGNTITNSLGAGIWTNMNLTGGTVVSDNLIVNPARSSQFAAQTAIYMAGTAENIQITNNAVFNTTEPLIAVALSLIATCSSSCTASGNKVNPVTIPLIIDGSGWTVSPP